MRERIMNDLVCKIERVESYMKDVIENEIEELTTEKKSITLRDIDKWENRYARKLHDIMMEVKTLRKYNVITDEDFEKLRTLRIDVEINIDDFIDEQCDK